MAPHRALATNAEVIAVRPGRPLSGSVTIDGSKNAALPLLAAAAAVHRTIQLENVPASADVHWMLTSMRGAGWHVARAVGRENARRQAVSAAPHRRPLLGKPERNETRAQETRVPARQVYSGVPCNRSRALPAHSPMHVMADVICFTAVEISFTGLRRCRLTRIRPPAEVPRKPICASPS